jgi:Na+/proline symporter
MIVLAGYLVIIMGIAVAGYKERGEATIDDHYLARGGLGNKVLILSTFSSLFSGYTVVGVPGKAYRSGYFSFFWIPGTIGMNACQLLVAPRLYRLSAARRYITPGSYLWDRYRSRYLRTVSSRDANSS